MRNKKLIIGVLCTASVVSCSIQETDLQEKEKNPVFYARIEQPSEEDGTRVYVNQNYKLLWDEGDEVSIFNMKDANDEYRFTGNTGDTGGSFELVKGFSEEGLSIDHRYAVYPYSQSTIIDSKGALSVELPATQHYREHSFGSGENLMVAVTDSKEFQFKNVCGYLVLKLYGDEVSVSSIMLKGNNGEKLAGTASVSMPIKGVPTAVMASDATEDITLTCETPVALGTSEEKSTQFWFVVPPVTFRKGFTVSILEVGGGSFVIETSKSVSIERSHLTKMSAKEVDYITPSIPIPEAVDLGLSVKWSSFNLGASTPEGFGDYYAWGEIEPYYSSLDPLIWREGKEAGYEWTSYKWCMGSRDTMTKYCSMSEGGYNGFTDSKTVLDPEDDVAWMALSGKWRMPTDTEFWELLEKCTWEWMTMNDINGCRVTGPNGSSIFLPLAGFRSGKGLYEAGSHGSYWTSTSTGGHFGNMMWFASDAVSSGGSRRCSGLSIRPVSNIY